MLSRILIANAASCLLFGLLFALFPVAVANFVGDPPQLLVRILGIGLALNGLLLMLVARKDAPSLMEVMPFVAGDTIWVAATLALIASGLWIETPHGIFASLIVALWVAACGLGQYLYRPDATPG